MSYDLSERATTGKPYELFLFTPTGQPPIALTTSDKAIVHAGFAFVPDSMLRGDMGESAEVSSSQCKVTVPKSHPLALMFIASLPPAPVLVTMWGGHFGDADVQLFFQGRVASAAFPSGSGLCELTCVTDFYLLQHKIPIAVYQPSCIHVFGDSGCGVNLASFSYSGAVISVADSVVTCSGFGALPVSLKSGYLRHGYDFRLIVEQVGNVVTLFYAIPNMQPGDPLIAVAGCDHSYKNCASYNNVRNFFGFDLVPTQNPFDGKVD